MVWGGVRPPFVAAIASPGPWPLAAPHPELHPLPRSPDPWLRQEPFPRGELGAARGEERVEFPLEGGGDECAGLAVRSARWPLSPVALAPSPLQ